MRLLIVTQTVDKKDTTLGFFANWIRGISAHTEHTTVFALKTGVYEFEKNVTVVPLRPWGHRAPMRTALRFLKLAWQQRGEYDTVFVHMNQEYLLIAGWLWRLLGKRVYMWRNHYDGSVLTDIAALFCHKVFYTSKSSYTAKYAKGKQMPVGVDVDSCHLEEPIERKPHSVLFLGRFDLSKRPDLLIEALGLVAKEGIAFTATFVGGPSDSNSPYPGEVKARAEALDIASQVSFAGAVPNTETYKYYRSHAIYVNASRSGMLDKSLFKSIACGCLPLFVSADMAEIVGPEFSYAYGDVHSLAEHLKTVLSLSEEARAAHVRELNEKAIKAHALPILMDRLAAEMAAQHS